MTGTARLRRGTPKDLASAAAVWVAATDARRAALGLPPAGRVEDTVATYVARFAVPTTSVVVAEDGADMLGMALAMQAVENDGGGPGVLAGTLHVSSVAVHPQRWGEGIGGQLVAAVLEAAASLGYRRVQLWTHGSNERAQALYRRHGFEPTGRTKVDDAGELIGHWLCRPSGRSAPHVAES